MFLRKKKNKSGTVSVQAIDKSGGKYRVIKSFGSSCDPDEVQRLLHQGEVFLQSFDKKQLALFPVKTNSDLAVEEFCRGLANAQIRTAGPELVFGTVFDRIGFNTVPDELFRQLVLARLTYPVSKLKTVDYLQRYRGEAVDADRLYRYLDTIRDRHKDQAERIAYEYTRKTLRTVSVVFYDMTTLYFEAEDEDDLRKIGFSKDGKFQCPQIMIGLLVGENGYPIAYDLFEGNTCEGKTLLPVLEQTQEKYGLPQPVVIADAGLLSKDNLSKLTGQGYGYIVGARIKNESDRIKAEILRRTEGIGHDEAHIIRKPDGSRLVVHYSEQRAKKDAHNRERGLKKLRQRVKSGKLTKESINNRGYNKFLTLGNAVMVAIDETKVGQDKQWDGLKGYVTNTKFQAKTVIRNYRHLWQIERAFRISKTDLRIRPIYHYKRKRIEAHLCIAFVAYTIYKEVERLLKKHNTGVSPQRAAELTHTMYRLDCMLPGDCKTRRFILQMDAEQQLVYDAVRS